MKLDARALNRLIRIEPKNADQKPLRVNPASNAALTTDGNRLNPGTTADLIAAGLFVVLSEHATASAAKARELGLKPVEPVGIAPKPAQAPA